VLQNALLMVFPLAMAFAAATDFLTYTIPNKVSIALVAAFAVAAPLAGLSWEVIGLHVLTGFAVLVVAFGLFAAGLFGGGDAKLLAAAALWIGYDKLLDYLLLVAISGAVLGFALLFYRRFALPTWLMPYDWALKLHDRKSGMPYGIALAAGGLLVYPSTSWFSGLAG